MKKIIAVLLFILPFAAMAQEASDSLVIYIGAEQVPEFPGGQEALQKFIKENLVYPEQAKKDSIVGSVYVSFIVEKDGSVSNVTVKSKPIKYLDDEAVRIVKSMPLWKPGRQNGKPVRVTYVVPIKFKLK